MSSDLKIYLALKNQKENNFLTKYETEFRIENKKSQINCAILYRVLLDELQGR